MYERINALIPKKMSDSFARELNYLNVQIPPKKVIGFIILFGLFLCLGLSINGYYLFGFPIDLAFVLFYLIYLITIYVWLSNRAESKGKFVESILPDALQLIASNIKSGLTTERALIVSARSEFGPFQEELRRASKMIMSGEKTENALASISTRIKSIELQRTLWLISEGIKSGGQISELLIELSDNLREQQAAKQEIGADVSIYVLLIFFTAGIAAPIMFGISSFIVEVLASKMASFASIEIPAAAMGGASKIASGMLGKTNSLSPGFILFFTMLNLVVVSVFSSLTIGVIGSGKEKAGAKFIPILLIFSFALFFAVRWIMFLLFGNIL
ncbi:MAG: type II secretion system F family protein [Candidatus Diapherotrites archaeon]